MLNIINVFHACVLVYYLYNNGLERVLDRDFIIVFIMITSFSIVAKQDHKTIRVLLPCGTVKVVKYSGDVTVREWMLRNNNKLGVVIDHSTFFGHLIQFGDVINSTENRHRLMRNVVDSSSYLILRKTSNFASRAQVAGNCRADNRCSDMSECAICCDANNNSSLIFECMHAYHSKCLFVAKRQTCPQCEY